MSALSVRQRRQRRLGTRVLGAWFVVALGAGAAVWQLAPRAVDRPRVVIHADAACAPCGRWAAYLERHGFSVSFVPPGSAVPAGVLPVRASLRSAVLSEVEGRPVHGFVPARELHALARGGLRRGVSGLYALPGDTTRPLLGSPARPLTVFALLPGGLMRPIATYVEDPVLAAR